MILSWLWVFAFLAGVLAQPSPQIFFPASVPLAIRSPYKCVAAAVEFLAGFLGTTGTVLIYIRRTSLTNVR